MQFTGNNAMQGDTQWFGLKELPANLKKIEKQFIAHSERSGSVHALFGNYEMYEAENGFVIDCKEKCILNHTLLETLKVSGVTLEEVKVLPKKDHRHTEFEKGYYFVGIQNRFDPLEGIKKRVID
jgi:hypothetical protein